MKQSDYSGMNGQCGRCALYHMFHVDGGQTVDECDAFGGIPEPGNCLYFRWRKGPMAVVEE